MVAPVSRTFLAGPVNLVRGQRRSRSAGQDRGPLPSKRAPSASFPPRNVVARLDPRPALRHSILENPGLPARLSPRRGPIHHPCGELPQTSAAAQHKPRFSVGNPSSLSHDRNSAFRNQLLEALLSEWIAMVHKPRSCTTRRVRSDLECRNVQCSPARKRGLERCPVYRRCTMSG